MMRHMGYKPGWWAVYFIYCAIPIAIYARILVKFAKEVPETYYCIGYLLSYQIQSLF